MHGEGKKKSRRKKRIRKEGKYYFFRDFHRIVFKTQRFSFIAKNWRLLYWQRRRRRLWVSFASYFFRQFSLLDVRSFLLNRISIESSYFHSHSLVFFIPSFIQNLLYCFDCFSLRFLFRFLFAVVVMILLTHKGGKNISFNVSWGVVKVKGMADVLNPRKWTFHHRLS